MKRSGVWLYFTKVDDRNATCNTCQCSYKHSGGTSNLLKHLNTKHPELAVDGNIADGKRISMMSILFCFHS